MRYEITLQGKPSVIHIALDQRSPKRMTFVGYDASKKDTIYFARAKQVNGREVIEIPMPIAPATLTLDINQEGGGFGSYMKVLDISVKDLPTSVTPFPPNTLEFYNFIKVIAERTGEMKPGFYISKDENFVVWVKEHLDGDSTPARVNRRTGVTKWNLEKMRSNTVFMRIFIGLHEYFHYALQTTDETAADTGALKVYLSMGFPMSEANYAMTKIFDNSPEAIQRVQVMDSIIKQFDREHNNRTKQPQSQRR